MADNMFKLMIDPNLVVFGFIASLLNGRVMVAILTFFGNSGHLWLLIKDGPLHPNWNFGVSEFSKFSSVQSHSHGFNLTHLILPGAK